jgi:hypothetical protein
MNPPESTQGSEVPHSTRLAGQSLTVAESKLGGHLGRVEVHKHA